ncbi:MAG: hypothetical protein WC679_00760 [Bacteroidales bacterium]|jgi:hypothetical protein
MEKELELLRQLHLLLKNDNSLLLKTKTGCCGDTYQIFVSETACKISEVLRQLEPYT